jgi:hypothetical protein
MSDQSQPSAIIFPVGIQPEAAAEPEAIPLPDGQAWGWLELFVLSQVLWGVLLFVPGSQSFRIYIRAFPYVASLAALVVCAKSGATDVAVPGARWIVAALLLLVANLVHEETWIKSGAAQIVFQLAIAAPVFWGARAWITRLRLERIMFLIFGAHLLSAAVGLLQVYFPARFMPPEFSSLALKLNPELLGALSYVGSGNRIITRPPGLSDMPGGASISGTIAALFGFALAMRGNQEKLWRAIYAALAVIGITVVYLTQVRSMLAMIVAGMLLVAFVRMRRGRVLQSGWIVAVATVLVVGAFVWAVAVGGESVQNRFANIAGSGMVQSYKENRGIFLSYTLGELLSQYPLGAGLGRWGMMTLYFGDGGNWQYPALHAELQLTGWLYDGGVLMWLFYGAALAAAVRYSYTRAAARDDPLSDFAEMVLVMQLLIVGLCFTGPVFNTQMGIMFWLCTAVLIGAERTLAIEAWNAELAENEEQDDVELQTVT